VIRYYQSQRWYLRATHARLDAAPQRGAGSRGRI
jgi:hypothetical protein